MEIISSQTINIMTEQDIVTVRKSVRSYANQIGLNLVSSTKLVTAASELTRNIIKYAKDGALRINLLDKNGRMGLQMIFEDQGPGIPDMSLAMIGGYTTGDGLGIGLSGSKRLVDEFDIKSEVDKGTLIKLTLWK